MLKKPRRTIICAVLLVLTLAVGAWLLTRASRPRPTAFGWSADATIAAGDGVRGHADGVRARFSDPFAVAIDRGGVIYVADAGDTDRIRRIDPDGHTTTLPGSFDTPSGLAIDAAGDLIVADTGANAIRKISTAGVVTILAGGGAAGFRDGPAGEARFNGPMGVAADAAGNVFVADTYNDRIRRIAPDGRVSTIAGGGAPGFADGQGVASAFDTPCGISLDHTGALLVADTGNDAIRRVGQDGRVSTMARTLPDDRNGPLSAPVGLATTWDGYVYISSFHGGRIVQISPSGELRVLAGRGATPAGNAAVRFGSPAGLALDPAGALYVADASKYAIWKLSPRPADAHPTAVPNIVTAPPALVRAARFPWPVAPQNAWHEVVGDLGEVRGNYTGEARDHLHAGLDIRADVGERALAAANEKVEDPLPAWGLDDLAEGLRVDAMTYIHVRVGRTATGAPIDPARFQPIHDPAGRLAAMRIKRGTRFRIGDPLGTVNRMAHVHLELGPPGGKVNAMALRLVGFADHLAPHIEGIQVVDASGKPFAERQDGRLVIPAHSGALGIVVDAWDQVDGDEPRRRLGLYRAGFQILNADGSPVRGYKRPRITIEFDRMPVDRTAVKIAYAATSGDAVHSDQPTRLLYVVTNRVRSGEAETGGWNPSSLATGDYTIRIVAADYAGNVALAGRDLPIRIR